MSKKAWSRRALRATPRLCDLGYVAKRLQCLSFLHSINEQYNY